MRVLIIILVRRNEGQDLWTAGAVLQRRQRSHHAVRAKPGSSRLGHHILVPGQCSRVHGSGESAVDPATAGQRSHRVGGRAQEHATHSSRQAHRLRKLYVQAHVRTISHHQRARGQR